MKNKLLFLMLGCVSALVLTNCHENESSKPSNDEITSTDDISSEKESSDLNSSNEDSSEEQTTKNEDVLLNENYDNLKDIKLLNNKVNNYDPNYLDSNKFYSEEDFKYEESYVNNKLVNEKITINETDDVKNLFYNGKDSARFVSNADGYAFTIPTSTSLNTDFSLGKYRSKLYNEDFTLTISYEHSNPYDNFNTYREEWLYRYLDNENFYTQNGLSKTATSKINDTKFMRGYTVDQYDLVIENPLQIKKNYYSIASIRKTNDVKNFMLLVLKSNHEMVNEFEDIMRSYSSIRTQGEANNNSINNLPVNKNPKWNEETKNYYDLLISQERTNWGIFTATLPDGKITNSQLKTSPAYTKLNELSTALDYNFDILPTYQHIGWGKNANNKWPITAARNMAGGNGFNGKPVIQMSYQFTTNNNNVSVGQTTDCYTPMFDIYRGKDTKEDSNTVPMSTKFDVTLRDLAQCIKGYGKPVLFRLNNEMNTDWVSYCGLLTLLDPDIFQATWRVIYNIFEEEGVDNCIWIFNPVAKTCPYSSWGEDLCYYPGLNYVQALGLTYYEDNNNNDVDASTFRNDYTYLYNKNNPVWNNYPWIISEFGCGSGGNAEGSVQFRNQASQVEYIKGMFNDLNDRANNKYLQNIKGAVWFSVNDGYDDNIQNQYELVIDKLPNTIKALKEGLALNK